MANFSRPIIEVRSLKTIICPNRNFTYDIPIHTLHKYLKRRQYFIFLNAIRKEISGFENISDLGLKKFKELLFDPTLYSLFFADNANKIDLITTQSSFYKLPSVFLVAEKQKKVMIWYSANSKPIYAVDDELRPEVDFGAFREIIDEHWVWNMEQVEFLESNGIKSGIAVGSVLFQDKVLVEPNLEKFVITYFDVTPFQGNGGFYCEKNATSVLKELRVLIEFFQVKYPNQVVFRLKPKRRYSDLHAKDYISLVRRLSEESLLELVPASANLYQIISGSDLVLAFPFTSPALIARELQIDSFYLSTGIKGWDVLESSDEVSVVDQLDDLLIFVEKKVEDKFRKLN
jgi:polysaccharide biosynthesis PFTS motif protein